jgi:cation transport ATPase
MNKVAKYISVFLFLAASISSIAGVKWADIGVNGLTCSLCSRSVEMSIRRLDFVDSVVMSLETTQGRIYFKKNAPIDFKQLAKAVVNAGFSVRSLHIDFILDDINIDSKGTFTFQGQEFEWLNFVQKNVTHQVLLRIVDEGFLPKKESAQWKKKFNDSSSAHQKIWHVVQES